MAYGAAKDQALKIDNVTGTLTEVTAYLTNVSIKQNATVINVETFGDVWKEYIRGQCDLSLSCEGINDPFMGTLLFNLGTAGGGDCEYYPQGTASGKLRYGGSVFLTDNTCTGSLDDKVTFTFALQFTGGGTVAAV